MANDNLEERTRAAREVKDHLVRLFVDSGFEVVAHPAVEDPIGRALSLTSQPLRDAVAYANDKGVHVSPAWITSTLGPYMPAALRATEQRYPSGEHPTEAAYVHRLLTTATGYVMVDGYVLPLEHAYSRAPSPKGNPHPDSVADDVTMSGAA